MQKRIIVIDDDQSIQDSVRLILERRGYTVATLSNGDAILSGDYECPDLFILDKQLPGIDGLDLCRYLKASPQTGTIPVMILSASPLTALQAPRAGAEAFLEKPFQMQELRAAVQRLIAETGS